MKRAKRFLCILLTLCMVLGMIPGTVFAANSGAPFTDVKEADWFYDAVRYVYENGMMSGTGASTFSPDTTTTRGMIVTILHRMEGMPSAAGEKFADVPADQYYSDAVAWASANNIVGGYGHGRFGPNDPITREQMATILYRYVQYKGYDTEIAGDISTFADGSQVSSYAVEAMNWAVGVGLISGVGSNALAPKGSATRAQVATILMRFCNSVAPLSCTVTFKYNYDNKGVYKTVAVKSGETVDKPANPARSGYSFNGWYTKATGGSQFDFDTEITGNITLYAQWSKTSSGSSDDDNDSDIPSASNYTVTFESNGGSEIAAQNVASGSTATEPNAPTKDGYVFDAWYTNVTLTTLYDFTLPVNADITLYAKWKSEAEAYYETNSELVDIIDVEESGDVLSEADVKSLLMSKGLGDNPITYEHSITGERVDNSEVTDGSTNTHPMYQTLFLSQTGEAWAIYVINGAIYANPVSFNLESNLDAQLLVSESETLTSYDDATNQFFVTIPHESEIILQTVDKINAEALDRLTIEELCNLSGATISETTIEQASYTESAIMLLSDDFYTLSSASTNTRYSSEDPLIVVSLGDSYASGEGIEPFYGQEKAMEARVRDDNWLAHRSKKSWPSLLKVPGIPGTMADYWVRLGSTSSASCRWFFAAASGATTWNLKHEKNKEYNRGWLPVYKGNKDLPPQLDAFNNIHGDVDYVTVSIGGNDVKFADIVTRCAVNCAYLYFGETSALEDDINAIWTNFSSTRANIKNAYEDIERAAGEQAAIIVTGYPQLFEPNGKGFVINKKEAQLVNKNVSLFNDEIESIVNECRESGMNIYFVDIESEFSGHEAYSNSPWLNKIIYTMQDQDLKDVGIGSAYSMHPNEQGAQAYARLVNAMIEQIENNKSYHNISGVITIADTDLDMTNNMPLEGALVSLELTSYACAEDYTSETGEYVLRNIPVGTYRITVSKEGYIPVTETICVAENDAEVIFNIAIEAISEEHSGIGFASGQIFDVGTGRPVSGMTLYIREGLENTTGSVVQTLHMNDITTYSTTVGLEAGNYTIQVVDERTGISEEERYVTSHFNIKILGGMTIDNQHGYVSNGLASEELRVVLTWGSTPSDLDSHMVGPDGTGGKFHEYYPERDDGSDTDLDVDDTSSYGPETITVYQEHNGTYVYAVHDYTNRGSSSSTALSNSGAQVKVYRGSKLLMTYNVPTNQGGTLWTVFSYDSTTQRITTINEMAYESSAGNVLMSAEFSLDEVAESVQDKFEYEECIAIIVEDIFSNSKEQN